MQIHMPDSQVEAAWFLLRHTQVPRNDFRRHIDWTERLETVVTDRKTTIGYDAWAGEVDADDVRFLADLCTQVEKMPGVLVRGLYGLESTLATWGSAVDEDSTSEAA